MCSATIQRTLYSALYAPLCEHTPDIPNSPNLNTSPTPMIIAFCTITCVVQAFSVNAAIT